MSAGITFSIRGALDPSYRAALAQSVTEAQAAARAANRGGLMMQRELRKEIADLQKTLVPGGKGGGALAAAAYNAPILLAIKEREDQITHISNLGALRRIQLAKTEAATRVAIERSADIAIVEARIAAAASGMGGGGHGPAGLTGIIRESLVIMREISMGRGTGRIAGSVTLLAQYLGLLNNAVKSTAAPALAAAEAAEKLAIKLDLEAVAAVGTAMETEALNAAKKQQIVLTEAQAAANRSLLTATITLSPVFFGVVGAVVAVAAVIGILIYSYHKAAVAAKNLADALNPLKQKYTELAAEQEKAAKAAKENADWIAELNKRHESESSQIERKIKLLKEEAAARRRTMEARGASDAELQALDRANLAQEKNLLEVEQKRLEVENDQAQAAEQAASKAAIAGPTMTDEKGRVINLDQAQARTKKMGEILDAAQEAMDQNPKQFVPDGSMQGAIGGPNPAPGLRPTNDNDVMNFTVGGKPFSMSVADAKKNFDMASAQAKKLAEDQAALDDVLKNTKSTATEKMDAYNRVKEDLENVNTEIGIANTDPRTRHGGAGGRSATERERLGIGAPQVANLQKQTLDVSKSQLGVLLRIDANINRMTNLSGNSNPDNW